MQSSDDNMESSESIGTGAQKGEGGKLVRSIYKGVYKCGNKFKAQIQINRVQHYLGLFDDEVQAAVAYDNHARIILGSRARTNFDEFGHASLTFPVAPTEPIKQEKLKLEHQAVESKVRGSTKSRKRLYIGINQRPRRYSEDCYKIPPTAGERGSLSNFELPSDMQSSAELLGQLRSLTSSSDRDDGEDTSEMCVRNDNVDAMDELENPVYKHQLHRPGSAIESHLSNCRSQPHFHNNPSTHPLGDFGYFPPKSLASTHPNTSATENSTFQAYYPLPFVPPSSTSAFLPATASTSAAAASSSFSHPYGESGNVLSAENLQQLNDSTQRVGKVKSLSAKTSLESMRSCVSPPTVATPAVATASGMPMASAHLGGQVSHWAGVLQTDPQHLTQVWRGTWVAGDGGKSLVKPPPSAFAKSPNHFEFTSEIEFAVDASGNQGAPKAGFLRGCYFRGAEDAGGVRSAHSPSKQRKQNRQTYEDRELFVEFAPSGVAHRYTATGSGEGDCGAFVVTGQFSAISCVLELTRQYIE